MAKAKKKTEKPVKVEPLTNAKTEARKRKEKFVR